METRTQLIAEVAICSDLKCDQSNYDPTCFIVKMVDDEVEVVACTSLILASVGLVLPLQYPTPNTESENIKHGLMHTFATEISLVHLTRCGRSCVLAGSISSIYVWMLQFSESCTHWLSQRLSERKLE